MAGTKSFLKVKSDNSKHINLFAISNIHGNNSSDYNSSNHNVYLYYYDDMEEENEEVENELYDFSTDSEDGEYDKNYELSDNVAEDKPKDSNFYNSQTSLSWLYRNKNFKSRPYISPNNNESNGNKEGNNDEGRKSIYLNGEKKISTKHVPWQNYPVKNDLNNAVNKNDSSSKNNNRNSHRNYYGNEKNRLNGMSNLNSLNKSNDEKNTNISSVVKIHGEFNILNSILNH